MGESKRDTGADNHSIGLWRAIGLTANRVVGENLTLEVHLEKDIQCDQLPRYQAAMKGKKGFKRRGGRFAGNPTLVATERMELYCKVHPGSPSAARRPQLMRRSQLWVALLGPTVEEGIVGIGQTVEAALRAFDAQYLAGLRPPPERSI
jgi:hypothetical protein